MEPLRRAAYGDLYVVGSGSHQFILAGLPLSRSLQNASACRSTLQRHLCL
jgi:hypothetical protein